MDNSALHLAGAAGVGALVAYLALQLSRQKKRSTGAGQDARIADLSQQLELVRANLMKTQQMRATAQPSARMAGRAPVIDFESSVCTEGAWFDGAPETQYELLACPDYVEMAENMVLQQPNRFRYHPTIYDKFPDGTDMLRIGGFTPQNNIMGRHIIFLASFQTNDSTLAQLHVLIVLLQSHIESMTIVLPFYPCGTMERTVYEGEVATANTLAQLISHLPSCGKPVRIMIYDIHTLQNRFYFGHNAIGSTVTTVPMLLRIMDQAKAQGKPFHAVAFPDDGAAKRFSNFFTECGFEIIICNKIRVGDKRIIEITKGDPKGKNIMIVDDLVRSGGTLAEAGMRLREEATGVSAFVPHAVFPPKKPGQEQTWHLFTPRSAKYGKVFDNFYVTNSIPTTTNAIPKDDPVITVLDLVPQIIDDLTRGSRSGTDPEPIPLPEKIRSIGRGFPRVLPPLSLQTHTHSMEGRLKMDPERRSCTVDAAILQGLSALKRDGGAGHAACSPLSAVTLPGEARAQAGIVPEAASFVWVYPLEGTESMDAEAKAHLLRQHPHFSFLFFGGFVYLDQGNAVVQVCAVELSHGARNNFVKFDPPTDLADLSIVAALQQQGRLQIVTVKSLRDAGCTHFVWLLPQEKINGTGSDGYPVCFTAPANGAFLYVFPTVGGAGGALSSDLSSVEWGTACFFPVAGS
jgi:phosphoribosylpyrophosphate synthetase